MEKTWEEEFDFYIGRLGDDPVGVFVDLGVGPHVPLPDHNVRVRLLVHMQNPRPDGLRSREESQRLFALEDQLVEELDRQFGTLMVGRVTVAGVTDLVFYAPGTMVGQLEALRAVVDRVRDEYQIDLDVSPDISWEFYREVLWPDAFEHQFIMSNRVLRQLEQAGDDPSIPRPLDHLVVLPDRESAERAVTGLRELGFDISGHEADEEEGFHIAFKDEMVLEGRAIHDRVSSILSVVLPLEGVYDGWGCTVMQPPGN